MSQALTRDESLSPGRPFRSWPPPRSRRGRWQRRLLIGAALLYLVFAIGSLDVDMDRIAEGWVRARRIFSAFLHPEFAARWDDIRSGLIESLAMAWTATLVGAGLSLPIGVGAACNLAPPPVYFACRALVTASRSVHEIVIAILFVAMVGFGPLAGFLTLTFATIGFLAKLLAEAVEAIDPGPVAATRAAGASAWQVLDYAVVPQVMPRLIGLVLYRLDINFRDAAVIGIVGAGGIGATLNTALDRYEYNSAAGVLLMIIGIVLIAETSSGWVRSRVR